MIRRRDLWTKWLKADVGQSTQWDLLIHAAERLVFVESGKASLDLTGFTHVTLELLISSL